MDYGHTYIFMTFKRDAMFILLHLVVPGIASKNQMNRKILSYKQFVKNLIAVKCSAVTEILGFRRTDRHTSF